MEDARIRKQWRWYSPKQDTVVTEREFVALPSHGQAVLGLAMKKYARGEHLPRHVKHIEGPIYEIRASIGTNNYRALFFNDSPVHLIVVRVFYKDTNKTPRSEIKLALKRMKKWSEYHAEHSKHNN
ncbi:type II toxin-antitoxin system RelE/ParE family toxin [Glutamicibacter protophormiae]|uniref:type II toxin-antitoxin system RelE/ParE family toxin n=1 Tax=Glutamicibacter protophormiae TaxID=37930 RepID=UPI0033212E9A